MCSCMQVCKLTAARRSICTAGSWTALEGLAGCAGRQTVPDRPDRKGKKQRESVLGVNLVQTLEQRCPDFPACWSGKRLKGKDWRRGQQRKPENKSGKVIRTLASAACFLYSCLNYTMTSVKTESGEYSVDWIYVVVDTRQYHLGEIVLLISVQVIRIIPMVRMGFPRMCAQFSRG